MHLPSESLNGAVCSVTTVAAIGAIAVASSLLFRNKANPILLRFTFVTLAVFTLQALNYPLPGGFSGHMLGAMFATVLLGIPAAILSMALVITVQCFFFADGGVLQLGANLLNMAVIAPLAGGIILNLLKKRAINEYAALCFASAASVLSAVAAIAIELVIGHTGATLSALSSHLFLYHLPIAALEGAVTAGLFLAMPHLAGSPEKKVNYALAALIIVTLILVPFASALPDALEFTLSKM